MPPELQDGPLASLPSPEEIRPALERAEYVTDMLRRMLRLSLDRQQAPEEIARRMREAGKGPKRA